MNNHDTVLVTAGALFGASISFTMTKVHYSKILAEEIQSAYKNGYDVGYSEGLKKINPDLEPEDISENQPELDYTNYAKVYKSETKEKAVVVEPVEEVPVEEVKEIVKEVIEEQIEAEEVEACEIEEEEEIPYLETPLFERPTRFMLDKDPNNFGASGYTRIRLLYQHDSETLTDEGTSRILARSTAELAENYGFYEWRGYLDSLVEDGIDETEFLVIDTEDELEYHVTAYLEVETLPND